MNLTIGWDFIKHTLPPHTFMFILAGTLHSTTFSHAVLLVTTVLGLPTQE